MSYLVYALVRKSTVRLRKIEWIGYGIYRDTYYYFCTPDGVAVFSWFDWICTFWGMEAIINRAPGALFFVLNPIVRRQAFLRAKRVKSWIKTNKYNSQFKTDPLLHQDLTFVTLSFVLIWQHVSDILNYYTMWHTVITVTMNESVVKGELDWLSVLVTRRPGMFGERMQQRHYQGLFGWGQRRCWRLCITRQHWMIWKSKVSRPTFDCTN